MLVDSSIEYTFHGITFKFSENLTPLVSIASIFNNSQIDAKIKNAVTSYLHDWDVPHDDNFISLTGLTPYIEYLNNSEIEFRFNAFLSDVYTHLHKLVLSHFNGLRKGL